MLRLSSSSPAKNSACDRLARTPTLRTSAPAHAAATARRPCSTAAPTSPRSITIARVTSVTASTYGDHSCRPLPPRTLYQRQQPLSLELGAREQRSACGSYCRQQGVLEQQLGGRPAHPAEKLSEPPAPDELEVVLAQQLGHHLGVPSGGGVLDGVLDEARAHGTNPPRGGAARARPRARAPAAEARRTDGDSDTTPRARPG